MQFLWPFPTLYFILHKCLVSVSNGLRPWKKYLQSTYGQDT